MNNFWLYNPGILLDKEKMLELWPKDSNNMTENLNAISRTIIVLTTLGFFSTQSIHILVSGIVTLIVIVALYKTKKNESIMTEGLRNMETLTDDLKKNETVKKMMELNAEANINKLASRLTKPNSSNPYMNYMMTDYVDNPNKKPALPLFNNKVKKQVDMSVASNLDERLFRSLGDLMEFDNFSRNFHTMPNTTNPNDQKAFAEFCYGNMKSCKEGDCYNMLDSCPENNYLCQPSYKESGEEGKEEEEEEDNEGDVEEVQEDKLESIKKLNPNDPNYDALVKMILSQK